MRSNQRSAFCIQWFLQGDLNDFHYYIICTSQNLLFDPDLINDIYFIYICAVQSYFKAFLLFPVVHHREHKTHYTSKHKAQKVGLIWKIGYDTHTIDTRFFYKNVEAEICQKCKKVLRMFKTCIQVSIKIVHK